MISDTLRCDSPRSNLFCDINQFYAVTCEQRYIPWGTSLSRGRSLDLSVIEISLGFPGFLMQEHTIYHGENISAYKSIPEIRALAKRFHHDDFLGNSHRLISASVYFIRKSFTSILNPA